MSKEIVDRCSFLELEIREQFGEIRLTIEMVPSTCWFSNARNNISKSGWDRLRKTTYEKANYRCEICGGQGKRHPVECHEIWLFDDKEYIQKLGGLIALCPNCHEVKHIGLASSHGRGDAARNYLANINSWTDKQTQEYLSLVKQIWLERSKHEWKLNLDWLKKQNVNINKDLPE